MAVNSPVNVSLLMDGLENAVLLWVCFLLSVDVWLLWDFFCMLAEHLCF